MVEEAICEDVPDVYYKYSAEFFVDFSVTRSWLYTGLGINSSAGVQASNRVHTLVDKKLSRVLIVL